MKKKISHNRYDYHTHIGQFQKVYYNPYKIIDVLSKCGIDGAYVSSTTSCLQWNTKEEKSIIVEHIKAEFDELLSCAQKKVFDARPVCWIIPQRYYEGDSVVQMYSESSYQGFKIHPRAHRWDIKRKETRMLLDDVCRIAENKKVPVIVHTGLCDFERPNRFEYWFRNFPQTTFILAHCKNIDETVIMLDKYSNLYGDVSFALPNDVHQIVDTDYIKRFLFGTDFPITTYSYDMEFYNDKSLYQNYKMILSEWEGCMHRFGTLKEYEVYEKEME